jgi:predicted DNA-binding transcriptional regulator YafY
MANPFANTVQFLKTIDLLASPKGATVKSLMENLCISKRSVFRQLKALEELGFPLLDEQPMPRAEKTYRLMDSYVLRLPNMAIPNPGFSEPETELLLSMLDFCIDIQQSEGIILLNGIREKVKAMTGKTDKESGK